MRKIFKIKGIDVMAYMMAKNKVAIELRKSNPAIKRIMYKTHEFYSRIQFQEFYFLS
jgi:hypothetical protein